MFGLQDNLTHVRGPVPGLKVKFGPFQGPCTRSQVQIWLTSGSSTSTYTLTYSNIFPPKKKLWNTKVHGRGTRRGISLPLN